MSSVQLANVLYVLGLLTSLIYLLLGFFAYFNQTPNNEKRTSRTLTPLWAWFPQDYDEYGAASCKMGRRCGVIAMSCTLAGLALTKMG